MSKVYYRRKTHTINGVFRNVVSPTCKGLGVHALDSKKWMTVQEYLDAHYEYKTTFPFDFTLPDNDTLLNELASLVQHDCAEQIISFDGSRPPLGTQTT